MAISFLSGSFFAVFYGIFRIGTPCSGKTGIEFGCHYTLSDVSYFSLLIENIVSAMEKTIPATAGRGIPLARRGLKSVVQRMQDPMNSTTATSVSTVYRRKWNIRFKGSSYAVYHRNLKNKLKKRK